jgi:hypothetical protein
LTPHERCVFVTLALIGVQLVVLAERSRTAPQSSGTTRESGASDADAARGEVELVA